MTTQYYVDGVAFLKNGKEIAFYNWFANYLTITNGHNDLVISVEDLNYMNTILKEIINEKKGD